jgi:zinc-ribbon family
MGFIFYGVKKATIGLDEFMVKCPSCEADSFADIMITSNYYHIYFVPIFPFEKEANIICQKCGLKRYDVPFNARTFKNYGEIKGKFRHPWYTYLFTGIMALTILIILLFAGW